MPTKTQQSGSVTVEGLFVRVYRGDDGILTVSINSSKVKAEDEYLPYGVPKLRVRTNEEILETNPDGGWVSPDGQIQVFSSHSPNIREVCHIVAGLRMLQSVGNGPNGHTLTNQLLEAADLAKDGGEHELMSKEEIDELIEKIN